MVVRRHSLGSSRINKRWPTAEQAIPKDVLCTSSRREGVSCGSFKGKFASETWEPKVVLHLNHCIGSIGVYHPVFEQQRGNVRGGSWTAGFFENQCGDRRVALIFGSPPEGKVHRKHGNQSESTPQRQTLWNAKTHELTRWYVAGNSPCHWASEAEIRNRLIDVFKASQRVRVPIHRGSTKSRALLRALLSAFPVSNQRHDAVVVQALECFLDDALDMISVSAARACSNERHCDGLIFSLTGNCDCVFNRVNN